MLNNTILNGNYVTEETKKENLKFLELNENENTACQNPWNMGILENESNSFFSFFPLFSDF